MPAISCPAAAGFAAGAEPGPALAFGTDMSKRMPADSGRDP